MCIICYKPGGAKMPSKKQFKTMFKHNPDGAGFMTTTNAGAVMIRKGFMSYSEFRQALQESQPDAARPYIFHFRIATHGGVNPEMTQPFALTDKSKKLRALSTTAAVGVAHNGIIPLTTDARKMSDTAEFIRDYMTRLYDPGRGFDDITLNVIEACISSRMAILEASGEVHLLGHGWIKDGGLFFSNESYIDYYSKPKKKKSRKESALYSTWSDWEPVPDDFGNWCPGECDYCNWYGQCYGTTDAGTDRGINSI